MDFNIFMVYPDETFSQVLVYSFEQEGWKATIFDNDEIVLDTIPAQPQLWILDAESEHGFKLVREIKAKTDVPVIMTADREKVIDRVLALEMGCDDFVIKPFLPREMVLRVNRLVEKDNKHSHKKSANWVEMHDYFIYLDSRMVAFEDKQIALTAKEFDLLLLFYHNRGTALSRDQIIKAVWGQDYYGSDRVVDDLIRRLRRKLNRLKVETLYGYGYRAGK